MRFDEHAERIPARSRLYSLIPIGIGTPDVEGLVSYLMRLAAAHAISIRYLLSELLFPAAGRLVSESNWMIAASSVNGLSPEAETFADVIAANTLRQDLHCLTMLPFKTILGRRRLLRRCRAWCPACLAYMRELRLNVYEKLVWAIRVVDCCPIHMQPLATNCPFCGKEQPILAANSVAGRCSRCFNWLVDPAKLEPGIDDDGRLWTATAVGEFAAANPIFCPSKFVSEFRHQVHQLATRYAGGSVKALSRTGINFSRVLNAFRDEKPVPLDLLLRSMSHLGTPVHALLSGEPPSAGLADDVHKGEDPKLPIAVPHFGATLRRQALRKEATSANPRPPRALAKALGYASPMQLWRADRQEYASLKSKSGRQRDGLASKRPVRDARRIVESSLKHSLEQESPKSVREIAADLGYAGDTVLRRFFPRECAAITARRVEIKTSNARAALTKALNEDPPPTLEAVVRHSGLSRCELMSRAKDLCIELRERRDQWTRARNDQLAQHIQHYLSEEPPLSESDICERLGLQLGVLRFRVPELWRQLKERHRLHTEAAKKERNEQFEREVRNAVLEIQASGEYPSAARVRALLQGKHRDWKLMNEAWRRALKQIEDKGISDDTQPTAPALASARLSKAAKAGT